DALNRLRQKAYNDGNTPTIKYGYDGAAISGCTQPVLSDANPIAYRTAMCDGSGHCADHYKDGTCKVNVDSATGQAGANAGKQLEGVLNKYDKAVNALNDKDKFNIKDSNGKVIGSMT